MCSRVCVPLVAGIEEDHVPNAENAYTDQPRQAVVMCRREPCKGHAAADQVDNLLDFITDLRQRLNKASQSLCEMAKAEPDDWAAHRLWAKAEGVRVGMAYVDEYLRAGGVESA